MSSTQEDAASTGVSIQSKKGTGTTRRSWTKIEEETLIAAVKEIIVLGWKSDNGFRAGYLNKLEESMKARFPGTDLKGTPHINSKLSTWKKNYYALNSILDKSGAGFNANHMIDCEDERWEQAMKLDPNIKMMRYKMWPYYEDWKEIYGKDRANGETAEDIADASNELQKEENTQTFGNGDDFDVSLEDLAENEGAGDSISNTQRGAQRTSNNKKRKMCDEILGLCDALADFGRKADARLEQLADSIAYDSRLGQACEDAFEQLGSIGGMTVEQRFDVCEILSANVDKVKIFKGLSASARPQYVDRLLKNKGK